ncbi:MAG: branched-chain amino acid ABC transporter substrate-binding protein [Desulfuromonadales bacterium]|nr:branched-chain amino acid ABC transporter substrate-binding protein [Desulfuromonadales bacterium]
MNKMFLRIIQLGLLLLLLLLIQGCGQDDSASSSAPTASKQAAVTKETRPEPAATKKPLSKQPVGSTIKIGVPGAHTGDLAPYGLPTKEGIVMLAEALNAKGGLLGKPVELLVMDDQCKPEVAANVATSLVSQGAQIVIGHICSGATKAALGIYQEAGVIVISPSATNSPLTKSGQYPNFYRTIAPDDMQGRLAATFATETLGAEKIAVIHDKGDYGKGFADYAKQFVEQDGKAEVVLYEGITPGAMDYSAVVQKVRREGADTVIFGGYHPEASKLISQMNKKRVKAAFIGPDGVKGKGFLEIAGKDAEGVYATGPMDVSKYALNQTVRQAYIDKYGKEPGAFFDEGASAWQAVVNAIETAQGADYEKLGAALKSSYVETAVGRIRFQANGDAEGVDVTVYQVQNGGFVQVQ